MDMAPPVTVKRVNMKSELRATHIRLKGRLRADIHDASESEPGIDAPVIDTIEIDNLIVTTGLNLVL